MSAAIPSPSSSGFALGPFEVHAYGLMYVLGLAAAVLITRQRWEAQGGSRQTVYDVALWGFPAGLIGGRLYFDLTSSGEVPAHWWGPFAVWDGGMGIWGGIALGTAVGVWRLRRSGVSVAAFMDAAAPALLVAQAIGRIGNYFNQELFGGPSALPWALEISPAHRPAGYAGYATFQPTFLYELIWNLALAAFLVWLGNHRRIRPPGLFALYVTGYSAFRIFEESLRIDPAHHILGLRLNFFVACLLTGAGAVWFARSQGWRPRLRPGAALLLAGGVLALSAGAAGCGEGARAAGLASTGADGAGAEAEPPRCDGHRATIVGTAGDDVIHGTPGRDVIWGGPGNDVIYGGLGNDIICGGAGDDLIHGGRGNDWIDGGPGTDRVFGDLGDDKVLGGPGNRDEVSGGLGIDTVSGGPGNEDVVRGDYGYDRMDGGPGKGDIASFATAVAGRRGSGVWVSLPAHRAFGDGHDRLFRFESIEGSAFHDTLIGDKGDNVIDGGPGNDRIVGGGGHDTLIGGQGKDACKGGPVRISCGREAPPVGSAYVRVDPSPEGGGGLQIVGGAGRDDLTVAFDEASGSFGVSAAARLAAGEGCEHVGDDPKQVSCPLDGPARWLMADLGPGNDRLRVEGSLRAVDFVRINGGDGNDVIHGGPEEDLIESGPGADRIYGGAGDDGLIGGLPGPTFLYGEAGGDLLAAGGGCAGGALVGGPGRDDASFAETQAHPGTLYISLAAGWAWINAIKGCHKVRLARSDEDIEGSFDNDVLIGDAGPNLLLGQPGEDSFYGRGGEDTIVAADGVKDRTIQCGSKGHPSGLAIIDTIDPVPLYCKKVEYQRPVAGLHRN